MPNRPKIKKEFLEDWNYVEDERKGVVYPRWNLINLELKDNVFTAVRTEKVETYAPITKQDWFDAINATDENDLADFAAAYRLAEIVEDNRLNTKQVKEVLHPVKIKSPFFYYQRQKTFTEMMDDFAKDVKKTLNQTSPLMKLFKEKE